jgi:hypothetical protein
MDKETNKYEVVGKGIIKVLVHKSTKAARFICRHETNGQIMMNARLFKGLVVSSPQPKSVLFNLPVDNANVATFLVRFGKVERSNDFVKAAQDAVNNL